MRSWAWRESAPGTSVGLNVLLFVLTCLTTLVAGSGAFLRFAPAAEPARLLPGVPSAFPLLAILGTHDFGPSSPARSHGSVVPLPYFTPAPPPFLFGTLGAIIRMGPAVRDR